MPPFLSTIFGSDQSSQQTHVGADQGLELSPEVTLAAEGEYEGADGTSHSYSNETAAGAQISTQIVVDAASGLNEGSM